MTTRILSAYFDDYRQGKKDFALLRGFLMNTFNQDPVRRGHLLNWLDQAQYENPIPVTDFLLLRKEVESALKSGDKPPIEDATLLAEPLCADPEGATLMAPHDPTLMLAQAETLVAPHLDATQIPERSDHAGLHDAATSFNPRRQATLTDSAAVSPVTPPTKTGRLSLIATATGLVLLAAAVTAGLKISLQGPDTPPHDTARTTDTEASAPAAINRLIQEEPTGAIGAATPVRRSAAIGPVVEVEPEDASRAASDLPLLASLQADALLDLIRQRANGGQLLPADDPASAHAALRELTQRFPGHAAIIPARVALKDAHLEKSDLARSRGDWETAQIHLDAAFDVLQPGQLTATAPSDGS